MHLTLAVSLAASLVALPGPASSTGSPQERSQDSRNIDVYVSVLAVQGAGPQDAPESRRV